MKKRALKVKEMKHLSVFLCSFEDVFLFKTFTERPGDITDCIALAQKEKPLDWQAILTEILHQIKVSGNKVWITWIGERLDILKEKGLDIVIMDEIDKLEEEFYDDYEKKHA